MKRFRQCKATRDKKEVISNTPLSVVRWCEKFRASRLHPHPLHGNPLWAYLWEAPREGTFGHLLATLFACNAAVRAVPLGITSCFSGGGGGVLRERQANPELTVLSEKAVFRIKNQLMVCLSTISVFPNSVPSKRLSVSAVSAQATQTKIVLVSPLLFSTNSKVWKQQTSEGKNRNCTCSYRSDFRGGGIEQHFIATTFLEKDHWEVALLACKELDTFTTVCAKKTKQKLMRMCLLTRCTP